MHAVQGSTAQQAHLLLGEHTGGSAAYVAMTRGRERNTVHIVADTVDGAREQWIAAFARDRADLGPAHAADQAAREAARYATGRPLPELLEQLRTAWTREQNALDVLALAEPAVAALREVAAIQTERDTQLPLLREAARQTRPTLAAAEARLQQTTAVVERDADRIRAAMLARWDAQRPVATAAAQTVQAGTGRFGQHRARVAEAQHQLADWAAFWKPYLPAMPHRRGDAQFALRWDNRDAHTDAFDHHAQQQADVLHPEHTAARTAAERHTPTCARPTTPTARPPATTNTNSSATAASPKTPTPPPP